MQSLSIASIVQYRQFSHFVMTVSLSIYAHFLVSIRVKMSLLASQCGEFCINIYCHMKRKTLYLIIVNCTKFVINFV